VEPRKEELGDPSESLSKITSCSVSSAFLKNGAIMMINLYIYSDEADTGLAHVSGNYYSQCPVIRLILYLPAAPIASDFYFFRSASYSNTDSYPVSFKVICHSYQMFLCPVFCSFQQCHPHI
jgi:hypothetical protein